MQMRRPGNSLDPCTEVQAFLRLQEQDGVLLRHWRGSWYQYGDGFYAELAEDDVQGMLVRHLNESANRLTTSIIANHKMQLKAQAGLASEISPPAWLGEPPRPWPAEEVLACRNELVHLPSLVGGCEHCLSGNAAVLHAGGLGLRFRFSCSAARALVGVPEPTVAR